MAQYNTGRVTGLKSKSFKKRKGGDDDKDTDKNKEKKGLSVRFSSPSPKPSSSSSSHSRPWNSTSSKKLSSKSQHNSPNLTSTRTASKLQSRIARFEMNKSKSVNNVSDDHISASDDDGMPEFDLKRHYAHKSHQRGTSHYAHKDYKAKYEKKSEQNRELNRTIQEQQFTINNLKKELRKYTKTEYHEYDTPTMEKHYERTIKHKEKEISNLRRRLKLAINDYEKVYGYYKKQLDLFRKNQQKWLNEQKANKKDVTKYVFADDIKRIKIRKNGVRIYFGDGADFVFDDIEVIR